MCKICGYAAVILLKISKNEMENSENCINSMKKGNHKAIKRKIGFLWIFRCLNIFICRLNPFNLFTEFVCWQLLGANNVFEKAQD